MTPTSTSSNLCMISTACQESRTILILNAVLSSIAEKESAGKRNMSRLLQMHPLKGQQLWAKSAGQYIFLSSFQINVQRCLYQGNMDALYNQYSRTPTWWRQLIVDVEMMQLAEVIARVSGSDDVYLAVASVPLDILYLTKTKNQMWHISIMPSPAILEVSANFSFQAL